MTAKATTGCHASSEFRETKRGMQAKFLFYRDLYAFLLNRALFHEVELVLYLAFCETLGG